MSVTTQPSAGVPLVPATIGTVFILDISTVTSAVFDESSKSSSEITSPSASYIIISGCAVTVPSAPDISTVTPTDATFSTSDVGPVTLIYVGEDDVDATAYPDEGVPVVLILTAYVLVSLFSMLSLSADVLGIASTSFNTCPSFTT